MIPNIPRLLSVLNRDKRLFEAMFEKRHRLVSSSEVLTDIDEERLAFLVESELLVNTDESIELDDRVLSFFEEVLEASGDVEIGDVDELLSNLEHNINLYSRETITSSKERYLIKIQRILKKIPNMILKSLNQLQLHIGLTYKTQKSHQNKIVELEHYQTKLEKLIQIEAKVDQALNVQDGFFKRVGSHETVILSLRLKGRLRELRISFNSLQQEVIEYINKTLTSRRFFEHMIKLKELRLSQEMRERTNVLLLLEADQKMPFTFDTAPKFPLHLEKEYVYEEEFDEIIEKLSIESGRKLIKAETAEAIDISFFEQSDNQATLVDIDRMHEAFIKDDKDLFSFVLDFKFEDKKSFETSIEIYCQMALMFEEQYEFPNTYAIKDAFEYLEIYPKKGLNHELS
jgi:hypothetical protein